MDDSKLLELAGLASGETYTQEHNPLERDDLALRLAVQCGLEVSFVDDEPGREGLDIRACVGFPASTERPCRIKYVFEDHRGDIFAATRRAIVRAAAEIGRQHD